MLKKKRSKKSRVDLTVPANKDAISYQISIRGPGVSKLTKEEANALTLHTLERGPAESGEGGEGQPMQAGKYQVRITVWRSGQSLDWQDDNPRAEILRANLRRRLQARQITFRKVGSAR